MKEDINSILADIKKLFRRSWVTTGRTSLGDPMIKVPSRSRSYEIEGANGGYVVTTYRDDGSHMDLGSSVILKTPREIESYIRREMLFEDKEEGEQMKEIKESGYRQLFSNLTVGKTEYSEVGGNPRYAVKEKDLSPTQIAAINAIVDDQGSPYTLDDDASAFDSDFPPHAMEFIVEHPKYGYFYVNTEGYEYARYILPLDFDPEYLRIEGVQNATLKSKLTEANIPELIKELGKSFGGDNASQMKGVQLLKGLATSDDPKANEFMKKLDAATTKISKEMTEAVEPETEDNKIKVEKAFTIPGTDIQLKEGQVVTVIQESQEMLRLYNEMRSSSYFDDVEYDRSYDSITARWEGVKEIMISTPMAPDLDTTYSYSAFGSDDNEQGFNSLNDLVSQLTRSTMY